MNKNDSRDILRKNKKKSKLKRILLFSTVVLCLVSIYVGSLFFQTYNAASNSYVEIKDREDKSKLRIKPVEISNDPVSVLILGVEDYSGEYDRGRSDTLIVATFNPTDQTLKMLSIPRDTRVEIPDYKMDKINHAYSLGDKELTIDTVEEFLEIPIDYYVTVNFQGFINIVDELGGVTVDVPFDFDDINGKRETFYFEEGEMTLSGEAALVYARMRKKDPRGDFGRNDRQKQIVSAVIDKLSTTTALTKIDDIVLEIGNNVETNVKLGEAITFRQKYKDFNSSKIETLNIEGYDFYQDNIYYFDPDDEKLETLKHELQKHLEQNPATQPTTETNKTLSSNDS
ncbi:LCP family protein required for cell wall assembly [Bacillus mesophilus]|uniref:LytR family transcriptional regulator n=1 Tax=Bacillus mesophilus TaxID=1808955 RepID=A0A6M0Q7F1_9BACI|nr:LCP family protein [Bacillus mesophilus]MBM7661603.1 LCP family protein required for cell wall assembly [Bacillus mesophilus]NEY72272.1 LytR family transcriptional regulator [Bacillus mesophilus]